MENTRLPTVHPCKHAEVLKSMTDAMKENNKKVGSHYALLIFLRFITGVIPTVEFDITGELIFE
jgi:ubiquitin-like-conjugating enzyme ATG3